MADNSHEQRIFNFSNEDLRYNVREFDAYVDKKDPTPQSPRWLSGFGLKQAKPSKKFVDQPECTEDSWSIRKPKIKIFPERSSSNSDKLNKLRHTGHTPTSKSEFLSNYNEPSRIWMYPNNEPLRTSKKQFLNQKYFTKTREFEFKKAKRTVPAPIPNEGLMFGDRGVKKFKDPVTIKYGDFIPGKLKKFPDLKYKDDAQRYLNPTSEQIKQRIHDQSQNPSAYPKTDLKTLYISPTNKENNANNYHPTSQGKFNGIRDPVMNGLITHKYIDRRRRQG